MSTYLKNCSRRQNPDVSFYDVMINVAHSHLLILENLLLFHLIGLNIREITAYTNNTRRKHTLEEIVLVSIVSRPIHVLNSV